MKVNGFWGDLTDISAKKEALELSVGKGRFLVSGKDG